MQIQQIVCVIRSRFVQNVKREVLMRTVNPIFIDGKTFFFFFFFFCCGTIFPTFLTKKCTEKILSHKFTLFSFWKMSPENGIFSSHCWVNHVIKQLSTSGNLELCIFVCFLFLYLFSKLLDSSSSLVLFFRNVDRVDEGMCNSCAIRPLLLTSFQTSDITVSV